MSNIVTDCTIPSRRVTNRNCSIPPGLPMEMHLVRSLNSEIGWLHVLTGSSSGGTGNIYGSKVGAKVDKSHETMLARAANKISGSCPKINRFMAVLLLHMMNLDTTPSGL